MIKLNDRYTFNPEINGRNARLVAYDGDVEKFAVKRRLKHHLILSNQLKINYLNEDCN